MEGYTCTQKVTDRLRHIVLQSVEHGCCTKQIELALKPCLKKLNLNVVVFLLKLFLCSHILSILIFRNEPHGDEQCPKPYQRESPNLIV